MKDWADESTLKEFFETYSKHIYGTARKSGLTDIEAQNAVQETMIVVLKTTPKPDFDPANESFKDWVMQITRSCIELCRSRSHYRHGRVSG